jgi:(p)ppGpp synthase/HD superfamily hydrolase
VTISYNDFLDFVRTRHAGQTSMNGEDYIEHLLRVVANTRTILGSLPAGMLSASDEEDALLVALGHDLFEDEKATAKDVSDLGGSESLIRRLNRLSRLDPKPVYQGWIVGIAADVDLVPLIVKLADNLDNNSDERINVLPVEKRSIRNRYNKAFTVLRVALDERIAIYTAAQSPRI